MKEMMYQWEQPYIVEHSKFSETFDTNVTSHEVAIKKTVAWYRQQIGLHR